MPPKPHPLNKYSWGYRKQSKYNREGGIYHSLPVYPLRTSFCCAVFTFSHPGDHVHVRPGEHASEISYLRSCTGRGPTRFLGSVSARLASVRTHLHRPFIYLIVTAMADGTNDVVGTFLVNMYVLLLSLFALLFGQYAVVMTLRT